MNTGLLEKPAQNVIVLLLLQVRLGLGLIRVGRLDIGATLDQVRHPNLVFKFRAFFFSPPATLFPLPALLVVAAVVVVVFDVFTERLRPLKLGVDPSDLLQQLPSFVVVEVTAGRRNVSALAAFFDLRPTRKTFFRLDVICPDQLPDQLRVVLRLRLLDPDAVALLALLGRSRSRRLVGLLLRLDLRVCSGEDCAALGAAGRGFAEAEEVVEVGALEEPSLHRRVFQNPGKQNEVNS